MRPLLTSALRSDCLSTAPVLLRTHGRSPGVSSAPYAQPPDLRFAPLMDTDFAVCCPLVRHWRLISFHPQAAEHAQHATKARSTAGLPPGLAAVQAGTGRFDWPAGLEDTLLLRRRGPSTRPRSEQHYRAGGVWPQRTCDSDPADFLDRQSERVLSSLPRLHGRLGTPL